MPSFPRRCRRCLLFLHPPSGPCVRGTPTEMGGEHSSWNWRLKAKAESLPLPLSGFGGERALADVSFPTPLPPLPASQPHGAQCRVPCAVCGHRP